MVATWSPDTPGLLQLKSGRLIRGRGIDAGLPEGQEPTFGLYLLEEPPSATPWESRWVRWPDFRLPSDRADASHAFRQAWELAASARVEVACAGGRGRTGTALACIAIIDGIDAATAVEFVRAGYRPDAVETTWQRRFVRRFGRS
jgi:hypothetical protein